MKIFFKILLILLLFFAFPSVNASESYCNFTILDTISVPNEIVSISDYQNQHAIVSSNVLNHEILTSTDKKEAYSPCPLYKACAQSKFIHEIYTKNYNKTYLSVSHRISPYLENEICTRAP